MRQSPFTYGSRPPRNKRTWVVLIIVIGAVFGVTLLAGLLDSGSEEIVYESAVPAEPVAEEPTSAPEPTAEPQSSSVVVPETNPYAAIQTSYHNLSSSEWTSYARSLVNRQVQWTGIVARVRTDSELWVTMLQPGNDAVPQVVLHLSEPNAIFDIGAEVSFSGTLTRVVVMNKQVLLHFTDVQLISATN